MPYTLLTPEERREMLRQTGVEKLDDILEVIPPDLRYPPLALSPGRSELDVWGDMRAMAESNRHLWSLACFRGAGAYYHYVPSAVGRIISRSEFYTSYTPYQPEASQGTLQSMFEFQSLATDLLAMDVANASVYDGATALAEAILMAMRITGRSKVVMAASVHPEYRAVVQTVTRDRDMGIVTAPLCVGEPQREVGTVLELLDQDVAGCVVQQPNFFGEIADVSELRRRATEVGALLIIACNPISLGLLKPPGEWGADVAVAEGQPLGIPLSFGGPYLGIMACSSKYVRQLPGRIVGMAYDAEGRRGFVLTLQAREQHIRREKATSNICTNQSLMALAATAYLSIMGPAGLRQVAQICHTRAHRLAAELRRIPGFRVLSGFPFFHEFALECPVPPSQINRRLLEEGILGGYELGRDYPELERCLLMCCTEMTRPEDIERLVGLLAGVRGT